MPNAAAIYARISSDQLGDGLGVDRQLTDCRSEAERRGWTVVEEYVDNDVSAYAGKVRPAYRRMMDDIADGTVDAVVVYHLDRLHRRPKELEEFVEACERAGMKHLASVQGDVNLGTHDGLLIARIMSAVAANESDAKSRRVRRKMDELAKAGMPHGGATRPFGYDDDRISLRDDEAAIVRQLADRFLAGESLLSLAQWLTDEGVPTVTGRSKWRGSTVRSILHNPRIAGLRVHRGEIVGEAVWPAIIPPEQSRRIRAKLDDPTRRVNRTARRYLLAGMLRCEACGATLMSHPRKGRRRYVCKTGTDFDGCGAITVTAERVEQLITGAVLLRLDTPELAAAMNGRHAQDVEAAIAAEEVAAEPEQLAELAQLYADRAITAAEWMTARSRIEARLERAEKRLARLQTNGDLQGLAGNGEQLRADWTNLDLSRQQAIIGALLDHAVIHRATVPGGQFDPGRVTPVWKL